MPTAQHHDELPRVMYHQSWQPDEVQANRFHAARFPVCARRHALEYQAFHDNIEIHGDEHDRPPSGIGAEGRRWKLAPRQIVLHDRMGFLAVSAAFAVPLNQLVARRRQTVGGRAF